MTTTSTAVPSLTPRLYETGQDLLDMQAMLMDARSQTNDWHYAHVGELMWAYFMVLCHLDPAEFIRLWHDRQGRLVAYAILGEDPSIDWQVLPQYEWSGIEGEVMAWTELRVAELRARDPRRWGGNLGSGSRQDNSRRIAFLEQHGFRYSGEFAEVNMLRSLSEPIPDLPLPAGFQVRALADVGETEDRAGAERDVWLPWTVGKINADDYSRLMRLPGYQRELDVVAVSPDGIIAAYVNCWIDSLNLIGDFGPVGARLAFRRQGLTRAVLLEGLRRFKARGMQRACVSTGVANQAARNLYESIGFRIVNQYLDYVKPA